MKLPHPQDILSINDTDLVHTRTDDGSLLILKAGEDSNIPETYIVTGISLLVFEAIDGKRTLNEITDDLSGDLNLDEDAGRELPGMVQEFAGDLLKMGIASFKRS